MQDFIFKKLGLWLVFTSLVVPALPQDGNPLQFLSDVSQSSRINPAFQNTSNKLIVGLPILAGTTVNWESNFSISNLTTDNFTNDFYNTLNEPGNAFFAAHIPFFYLGFKNNSGTFSFSVSEKTIGEINFDNEIVNFIAQGLRPYYGKNEDLGPLSFSSQYYREITLGYSTQIIKNLQVGVRPKILFSKFYYGIEKAYYKVETLAESEMLVINPKGNYTVSGPLKVVIDEENETETIKPDIKPTDYFLNFRNMGAGIDLGLVYNPNKATEFAVSILDIGFTRLRHKTYNVEYTGSMHFKEKDLYQSSNPDEPDYWSPAEALAAFSDSVPHITTVNNLQNGLVTTLPLQVNVMLRYKLPNRLQMGISNHFTYYKSQSAGFLSGFIYYKPAQNFEVAGTLNFYNFKQMFPGIGASYTGKSVQYFLTTNNFLELVQPSSAKNLNLCFGVNFLFSTAEN
ncbi:DUF5723 family protein [Prolixibacteraceae bacterium Z1-6]|uniref:DUF5723 family protein n=1 Tax=Draconibacterium aestuarii TaxID=2998507 RepID=A0A9X3F756_9BACT|nr:DUF5723 family protein [Prolixibacteraceae bacterium Z1-6]